MKSILLAVFGCFCVAEISAADEYPEIPTLEKELFEEDAAELGEAARERGDAVRGAILFYQQHLTCTKCHEYGKENAPLGPDLSKPDQKKSDAYLVESILDPSKAVRKGYETTIIATDDGLTHTGLVVKETDDQIELRDPLKEDDDVVVIEKDEIEEQFPSEQSVMPPSLANQLVDRQQFLDLVKYVMEVTEGGPQRAEELLPDPSLYAQQPLPEYENDIDHAGMIRGLDGKAFERGKAIYERLCVNCHGTKDQPGSLPTSLRFASGKFRSGSDPLSMYRTLTHGFGMMTPQTWMVPQQKYDAIHYIREHYLKPHNPSQFVEIDDAYLARLPKGSSRGPAPSKFEPWVAMDYGPHLTATYEVGNNATNFAYKGIAVRLDAGAGGVTRGRYWMIFDEDTLRMSVGWSGEAFIDYRAIMMNGQHGAHPRSVGEIHFENKNGPGWANPATGSFEDARLIGRDKRRYGPLPRDWAHYKGLYHFGNRILISYTVGKTEVLEMPGVDAAGASPVFTRTLNIGPRETELLLRVADGAGSHLSAADGESADAATARMVVCGRPKPLVAGVSRMADGMRWRATDDGRLLLTIPAGDKPLRFTLSLARLGDDQQRAETVKQIAANDSAMDLAPLTKGGPPRWPEILKTEAVLGDDDLPLTTDRLTYPKTNPWFCRVRTTGFDFMPDLKRAAVSTWDGSVWMVSGIDDPENGISWQRIASGMFQPLGVKVVDGKIHISCRDQIAILHDLNDDGEIDFYQNFNNDHQVTEHFHEFAMGLQTDAAGNFYYAKSARHAKTALVPHHGTLLKVSKDGSKTEILAKGFRAANGVCVNPDGSFFVTDQEGNWNPKNRINWVVPGENKFYGNMWGYHDVTDESDDAMEQPLCWITNSFDRSPAELLWVDSEKWGPLAGALLNTSYGYGMVYVVPHERVDGRPQGGMCQLPISRFPTGVMRGRFHPDNGQLYLCGMYAWAGNQRQPGGFYRLRYTGKPLHMPVGLNATTEGMVVTFTDPLDPESAKTVNNWNVTTWGLKRSSRYGSDHLNTKRLTVSGVELSEDGKTALVKLPDIEPTWCMEIRYKLKGAGGERVENKIHNSVHRLGEMIEWK
jgi:putative heme-binding domain-containing protein